MSNMTIIGAGKDAFRLFRDPEGCELRGQGLVIQCNEDLAMILDFIMSPTAEDEVASFASSIGETEADARSLIREVLQDLDEAGVPLDVWPELWTQG